LQVVLLAASFLTLRVPVASASTQQQQRQHHNGAFMVLATCNNSQQQKQFLQQHSATQNFIELVMFVLLLPCCSARDPHVIDACYHPTACLCVPAKISGALW
jgi:Na+(H+)/acetate symporter ActP